MKNTVAIALVFVGGCAAFSAYDRLTPDEKDMMQRCRLKVEAAQCGTKEEGSLGNSICMNQQIEPYANSSNKKKWLVRHGCPSEMLD